MMPEKKKFEKIDTNDFVSGVIEDIQREKEHESIYKGVTSVKDCVRFIFKIDGYKDYHYSGWMLFAYGKKCNLFTKYLVSLIEGALPYMNFDLDQLKGMKVKMLWQNNPNSEYQHIETIRPFDGKKLIPIINDESVEEEPIDEVPF